MATNAYIGINGVARKVKAIDIGVNNIARNVTKGYIGVNGIARLFYTSVDVVIPDTDIGRQISNGYIYNGRMWVYSFYTKMLYGVSLSGSETVAISVESNEACFTEMVDPSIAEICLTIIDGYLFLTQWRTGSSSITSYIAATDTNLTVLTISGFTGEETSINLTKAVTYGNVYTKGLSLPYVQKETLNGTDYFVMAVGAYRSSSSGEWNVTNYWYRIKYWRWTVGSKSVEDLNANLSISRILAGNHLNVVYSFNKKNNREMVYRYTGYKQASSGAGIQNYTATMVSSIKGTYSGSEISVSTSTGISTVSSSETPIVGKQILYLGGANNRLIYYLPFTEANPLSVDISSRFTLPSGSTQFVDAAVYCSDKDMWFFFVGTGLIYTSDLTNANKYFFFNTQESIGTLTRFGYMDYMENTSQLVIVGQDTNGKAKVATISATDFV